MSAFGCVVLLLYFAVTSRQIAMLEEDELMELECIKTLMDLTGFSIDDDFEPEAKKVYIKPAASPAGDKRVQSKKVNLLLKSRAYGLRLPCSVT